MGPYYTIRSRVENYLEKASKLRLLLTDHEKLNFVLVTIPEKMGLLVTEDMAEALERSRVDCNAIVINFLIPKSIECEFCALRRDWQIRYVKEYHEKFKKCNIVEVSVFPQKISGLESVKEFAKTVFEGREPKIAEKMKTDFVPKGMEVQRKLKLGDYKLILFGGKGGCGKTTCSAALGIHLARKGKKTLVVSTDPQRSLSDSLGQKLLDDEITLVGNLLNLDALEINTEKAVEEFKEEYRDGIMELATTSRLLTKREVEDLLELPIRGGIGIDEALALMRLVKILREKEYETIILDTAPTGHTMRLLELPNLAAEWLKFLLSAWDKVKFLIRHFERGVKYKAEIYLEDLLEDARMVKSELLSPSTRFVPVTTLDEMAMMETERFVKFINSYQIPLKHIIINKLVPPSECPYCASEFNTQQKMLREVREKFCDFNILSIPLFPYEIQGTDALIKFAEVVYAD